MDSNPDRRAQILQAVLAIIARRGIDAVTIRSVAAGAGVSIGLVQHYFPSKQELIRAAAGFMVELAEAQYLDHGPRPAREQLLGLMVGGIALAGEAPLPTSVFFSFVAAAVSDAEIAGTLAAARRGMEAEVAGLLRNLVIGTNDPAVLARRLVAISDGLTIQVLIGQLDAPSAVAAMAAEIDRL